MLRLCEGDGVVVTDPTKHPRCCAPSRQEPKTDFFLVPQTDFIRIV